MNNISNANPQVNKTTGKINKTNNAKTNTIKINIDKKLLTDLALNFVVCFLASSLAISMALHPNEGLFGSRRPHPPLPTMENPNRGLFHSRTPIGVPGGGPARMPQPDGLQNNRPMPNYRRQANVPQRRVMPNPAQQMPMPQQPMPQAPAYNYGGQQP